jgi:hypothetical protein
MFMEDNRNAVAVLKSSTPQPDAKSDSFSTSLVWVVSGATNLTKVTDILTRNAERVREREREGGREGREGGQERYCLSLSFPYT